MQTPSLPQFVQLFTLADAAATARLTARLSLVLSDPANYQAQFAEELGERGIETELPAQELRDVALIDALLGEELLWEADWTDPVADIAYGINETLTKQNRIERLDEQVFAKSILSGPEALDAVQEALEPLGLAVVLFTLDSDSYPLSVVADAQTEETRRLAQGLGFKVTVY